jgi:hypothetical protein
MIHTLIFYVTLLNTAKLVYSSKVVGTFEGSCGCLYWELYKTQVRCVAEKNSL